LNLILNGGRTGWGRVEKTSGGALLPCAVSDGCIRAPGLLFSSKKKKLIQKHFKIISSSGIRFHLCFVFKFVEEYIKRAVKDGEESSNVWSFLHHL
jgi:hypothetical protein